MICLGNKKYTELNGLLRLLNMMMVDNYLTKQEKRHILTDELDIEITPELERGVDKMCNLSEGIEKKGFDKGREEEKLASARLTSQMSAAYYYVARQSMLLLAFDLSTP